MNPGRTTLINCGKLSVGTIHAQGCLTQSDYIPIEGRTMNMHWITSSVAAVTIATFMSAAPAHAAMTPRMHTGTSILQHVDCAVGFHIGPAGACILGAEEEHHDVVIEKRGADEGCSTKTVKKTNGEGDSVTKTTSNCD
jgi:hypothetical protein